MVVPEGKVRLDALPPFSAVVARLLEELAGECASFRRLSRLVSEDPALAAQVLRLANSALYGRRGEVSSLLAALSLIGADRLRALVLTYGVRQLFRPVARLPLARKIWRHSLASAILAADFAMDAPGDATEDYTCALLHDVGRLVLLASDPERYVQLAAEARGSEESCEREESRYGMAHPEAGAAALQRYRLPARLAEAARRHHEEDLLSLARANADAALIASCCRLATASGFGVHESPTEVETEEKNEPDDLVLYVRERMAEIETSLGLGIS